MRILYVSKTRLDYSLNSVWIKGLKENGVEVLCFKLPSSGVTGYLRALSFVRKEKAGSDALIVGYDSSLLAVFLHPFYWKKMIYCAVLPVYERLVTSRKLVGCWSPKSIYYWLIDFLAYYSADLSMIESDNQIDYISRHYFVSKNKFVRSWIGADENNFFRDSDIPKLPIFTVLFRGILMPEAGAEYVVQAAKILEKEKINFIMISGGMLLAEIKKLIKKVKPKNLEIKSELLSYEELRTTMQKCHLSLGQLSDHSRLKRTVPHKSYESLAMRLPYLTASNAAIFELVKTGETCISCEPANAKSLADKILWAKNNYQELEKIAENGYQFYQKELKSKILAQKLLDKISTI